MATNKSWSIDNKLLNLQFGREIVMEKIKDGKLREVYKNPIYTGITPQFWNSCNGVRNKKERKLWEFHSCGKGEPR